MTQYSIYPELTKEEIDRICELCGHRKSKEWKFCLRCTVVLLKRAKT